MTNRDLYLFITALPETQRSLEEYLRALWGAGRVHREATAIAGSQFAALLATALDAPAPAEEDWQGEVGGDGFALWETTLRSQIRDLQQLRATGRLEDEYRYFGIDAPSGARWYNFDPSTYLECAACGTFGGWCEGDSTGRGFVPGQVAVFDEHGGVTAVDPRDIENPVVGLDTLDWNRLVNFLWCGQAYE